MIPPMPPTGGQPADGPSMLTSASGISSAQLIQRLPVDVYAEFEPQRLPLGYVQQMSEGLLVDVGHLSQNRVRLHVDGKTVALGELVIVGDRFGVLITEIPQPDNTPHQSQFTDELRPLAMPSGSPPHSSGTAANIMPPASGVSALSQPSSPAKVAATPHTSESASQAIADMPSDDLLMAEVDRLIQGNMG
ncbi:MAG: FliM/FliN family flagellar motor switch protein [Vampirovibrionales bacterium]|nr:FliM/FliN family flagellar motor switch protein [Vampirovibrionales bacterium]